jgi:hypothetical protein
MDGQKLTYQMVENRLTGETEKSVWAMIRDGENREKASINIRSVLGDGIYPAIEKLQKIGAIEKVQRGLYRVSENVRKK